jgi:uncharacterized protein
MRRPTVLSTLVSLALAGAARPGDAQAPAVVPQHAANLSPTAAVPPSAAAAAGALRILRVSGEGRAYAAPDVAVVTLAVTALDPSLQKATRDVADRARRLLEEVKRAGVAPADAQTARYDVQIERRMEKSDQPPVIAGYRVTNAVRVKVRDLARLGALLDRATAAGANEVEGLALLKDDTSVESARALAAAVRAARAKAEEMARAAGLRLGDVLELSEGGRGPRPGPFPMRAAMARDDSVPVAEGQIEVSAEVEMVFAVR